MPGETFVYDFVVEGTGSHWYHSHFLEQYVDGVLGALIVRSAAEMAVYADRILLVKDVYPADAMTYLDHYLSPAAEGAEPSPTNGQLNGAAQTAHCVAAKTCRYSTVEATSFTQTCGKHKTYDAVLKAQAAAHISPPSKITRLHVIAGNALVAWDVSVDGHQMWVLTLDGQPVEPFLVRTFRINAGQRVTVAMCSTNPSSTAPAWIRTGMVWPGDDTVKGVWPGAMAILYYPPSRKLYGPGAPGVVSSPDHATVDTLTTTPARWDALVPRTGPPKSAFGPAWTPHDFVPEPVADVAQYPNNKYPPPLATREVTLNIGFYQDNATGINFAEVDGVSWVFPTKPLLSYLQGPQKCQQRLAEEEPWIGRYVQALDEEEEDEEMEEEGDGGEVGSRKLQFGGPTPYGTPAQNITYDRAAMCNCLAHQKFSVSSDEALCRCVLETRRTRRRLKAAPTPAHDDGSAEDDAHPYPESYAACPHRRALTGAEDEEVEEEWWPHRRYDPEGSGSSEVTSSSRDKSGGDGGKGGKDGKDGKGGKGALSPVCTCLAARRRLRAAPGPPEPYTAPAASRGDVSQQRQRQRQRRLQSCPQCKQGFHVITYPTAEVMQVCQPSRLSLSPPAQGLLRVCVCGARPPLTPPPHLSPLSLSARPLPPRPSDRHQQLRQRQPPHPHPRPPFLRYGAGPEECRALQGEQGIICTVTGREKVSRLTLSLLFSLS